MILKGFESFHMILVFFIVKLNLSELSIFCGLKYVFVLIIFLVSISLAKLYLQKSITDIL